jgi:hypothetical protein
MAEITKKLHNMIDYLPEKQQYLIFELVYNFFSDDIATPEDFEDIAVSRAEYSNQETIRHEDINWD